MLRPAPFTKCLRTGAPRRGDGAEEPVAPRARHRRDVVIDRGSFQTRHGFSNTDALYFIAAVAWLLSCFATAHAMGLLTQSSKEAPSLPGTDEAKDNNV